MNIFYNENDHIIIRFNFETKYEGENKISINISPEGEDIFEAKMYPRRFDMIQMVVDDCFVINHVNGNTMLKSSLFKKNFIKYMTIDWNQCDNSGKILEINDYNINRIDDKVIKHIIRLWNKLSGDKPLFEEI